MYLRLHLENFRLFAALRAAPERSRGAIVLVDESGRVVELNEQAQAQGLSPGMSMARALGRCGRICVLHTDPEAERSARQLLWQVAWQLTSRIEVGEGALAGRATLELVQPDLEALAKRVPSLLERLRDSGLPGRAGLAATPEWAGLAAASAERGALMILSDRSQVEVLLAELPLAALDGLSEAQCRVLEGWGLRSLAAVAALPRQDLGERLGASGLKVWDLLNGCAPSHLQVCAPAPDYHQSFELEDPVQDLPSLRFLLQQATIVLERQLEQSSKLARALSLDLWMEAGQSLRKTIQLPEATRRAQLMEQLLANYLEAQRLASPVIKMRVAADPVDPLSRQAGLFERSVRNPWRLQETLDQLAGLLGSEAFGVPQCRDSHRPDDYRLMPLPGESESGGFEGRAQSGLAGLSGPPRIGPPMRRFRPPLPARVLLDGAQPAHVSCSLVSGEVGSLNGPYAMSGDWAEAEPWAYVEWDVALGASGVFCLRCVAGGWHLVGAYD